MVEAATEDAGALPSAVGDDPERKSARERTADERSFIELLRSKVVR
jgi:hypothetical protein